MPILNVLCPICTETFTNPDDVYSTNCGHVFHLACLNSWQRQGTSCPQCRQYNPTTHKLYLSFDETGENSEELEELKLKLQSSNEKNEQLQDQINDVEFNFLQIQEQFTISEQSKKKLEERICQMTDSEENFLQLQGQYTETSEHVKNLEYRIQQLEIEYECKSKELRLKHMENESLKASIEVGQNSSSNSILNEKVKLLEQKLKLISSEFEKEITNSTQLSIEKMKLQSYINHLNTEEKAKKTVPKIHAPNNKENTLPKPNAPNNNEISLPRREHLKTANKNNNQINRDTANSVFIKEVPLKLITSPLEDVIVSLAFKMCLSITQDDLIKVNLANNVQNNSSKTQLCAQFKSTDLKNKFLSNKNILKNYPETASIILGDYMDDQLYSLFKYAKEKLRNIGLNIVFCKNGQIFAKKHRNHHKVIRISSITEVDNLLNTNKPLTETSNPDKLPNVDENLYQI